MRNLNNFPDDLFELSGKRLMAMAMGFVVFGGTLGAIFTQKLIRRDILANQVSQELYTQIPPPAAAYVASTESVATEWFYPTARTSEGGGGGSTYDLTGDTTDDYKTVCMHYVNKIDYASMVQGGTFLPEAEGIVSVSHSGNDITRGMHNHYAQDIRYCQFSWEDKNHLVRVHLTPLKMGTFVSTFVYRKTK